MWLKRIIAKLLNLRIETFEQILKEQWNKLTGKLEPFVAIVVPVVDIDFA